MKKIFFVIAVCFTFLQCDKAESDGVWLTYGMTQCADAWHDNPDFFNNKTGAVKKYLEEKSINVLEVKITTDAACKNGTVCAACICTSCDAAEVLVPATDVAAMEALKFVKK